MAIAFRSATEAGTAVAATTQVINVPAGVVADDLLLLFIGTADGDTGSVSPSGTWQGPIVNNLNTGGAAPSPPGMSVYWRIAASEPASYTITDTESSGIAGQMLAFSGVDTTTPIDVTTTTAQGDSTNADPPSIDYLDAGAAIVVAAFWDSAGGDYTAVPSGYTSPDTLGAIVGTGGGNGLSLATAYDLTPAADPENPPAFTSSTEQWGAVTVALRPAVAYTTEQDSFRFYDDGTESGSTALEAQNIDLSIARETTFHVRVGGQMTGDAPAISAELQYKETADAASEWRKVP